MISTRQLSEALYGIWLLLRFDPRGLDYFDMTPGGFARSFLVAGLLAPFQLAHVIMVHPQARSKLALEPFVVVQMLTFVLAWVLFPFVMLYVTELLNRRERYFWQMVPYNWIQLLILLPWMLVLLMDLGILPGSVLDLLNLIAITAVFVYGTFIARFGLQVGYATAVGIMFLNMVIGRLQSKIIGLI